MKLTRTYHTFFLSFWVIFFYFILLGVGLSFVLGMTIPEMMRGWINGLYVPDKNLFAIPTVKGWSFYGFLYLTLGVSLLSLYLIKKSLIKPCAFFAGVLVLGISVGLQTIQRHQSFQEDYQRYHAKSLAEKISVRFKNSYHFAQYCQKYLKGRHTAGYATDLDIQQTQSMLTFFAIAYYLYPIDIRTAAGEPQDSLVIFLKKQPLKAVPEGFRALAPFDATSLLAVKEAP